MPLSDPARWDIFRDWPLPYRPVWDGGVDPPRLCEGFEHNLRMEGDWTDASARRIAEAYRRFLYLKSLSGDPVTPPECIDRAWHLHLEFPADYAALCRRVGHDIPHRTDLTYAERNAAYDRGRAMFEAEFDSPPAKDLWPAAADVTRSEVLHLVTLGAALSVMFAVVMASAIHTTAAFAAAVGLAAVAGVVVYVMHTRVGSTSPDTISRCG